MENFIQDYTKDKPLILIVDDVAKNLQVLGAVLYQNNFEVAMAESGTSALEILKELTPDLVLLDIMMPEMDGLQTCKLIREQKRLLDVPVIFLTAKNDTEDVILGLRAGAADYVSKPFNSEELLARVNTHLDLKFKTDLLRNINEKLEEQVQKRTEQLTEANQRLKSLDKAKSYFLGLLSHELLTPLNGINGFTSLLKSELDDEDHLEYCDFIMESSARLKRFADLSLLITQLRTEQYELTKDFIDVDSLVSSTIRHFKSKFEERNISAENTLEAKETLLHFDINLSEKVLGLVLDNALKFTPNNSAVYIIGKKLPEEYTIEIIDSGNGFRKEDLENVFEYFTSDDLMHHKEGYGLGLAAAKVIMEAHNGHIEAENSIEFGALVRLKFRLK